MSLYCCSTVKEILVCNCWEGSLNPPLWCLYVTPLHNSLWLCWNCLLFRFAVFTIILLPPVVEQWWNWGEKSQGKTSDNGRILLHYSGSVPFFFFFFLRCGYHSDEKVGMWSHWSYEVNVWCRPHAITREMALLWENCPQGTPKIHNDTGGTFFWVDVWVSAIDKGLC